MTAARRLAAIRATDVASAFAGSSGGRELRLRAESDPTVVAYGTPAIDVKRS